MEYVPTERSSRCPGLGGHISTSYLWWPVYMWISISTGLKLEDSRPKQKFTASVHFLFCLFFFCLISYKIFSASPDIELSHFWPYYSFRPGAAWGWVWPRNFSSIFCISIAAGLFAAPGRCRVLQLPLTPSTCTKEDSASPTNKFIKIGFDCLFQVVNFLPMAVGLDDMLKSSADIFVHCKHFQLMQLWRSWLQKRWQKSPV